MGLTSFGKHHMLRVCVLRHVRWIANSPLDVLGEPNHDLLRRLGLCDPVVHLYDMCLRLWCKRWNTLKLTSSSDIMHQLYANTIRDWNGECAKGPAYLWIRECANWAQWLLLHPSSSDLLWRSAGMMACSQDIVLAVASLGLVWSELDMDFGKPPEKPLENRASNHHL